VIGFVWNLTIGPFVDLFAPAIDAVYVWSETGVGIAFYFLYAIPEEIGWTGCLYPMMLRYFSPTPTSLFPRYTVLKAMTMTGLVWGLWHCPYIILKWNPSIDSLSSFVYNILFLLSCIGTRFVLVSLVWPIANSAGVGSNLLADECTITRPSLFPAIFAHAAMNVWWNYYNLMYKWDTEPTWSILISSEYSVLAVVWQLIIGLLLVRPSWKSQPRPTLRQNSPEFVVNITQ
jgi:membrane protease YdiL (CAAX protease family)